MLGGASIGVGEYARRAVNDVLLLGRVVPQRHCGPDKNIVNFLRNTDTVHRQHAWWFTLVTLVARGCRHRRRGARPLREVCDIQTQRPTSGPRSVIPYFRILSIVLSSRAPVSSALTVEAS